MQNLQRDIAGEAGITGAIDLSPTASTERGEDFIGAKLSARGQGHAWE
jgi:hypothetical protein